MERLCLGGKRSLVMVNDGAVLRDSLNADYSREAGWLYRRRRLALGLWASAIISAGRAVVRGMIGHRPFQSGDLRCSSDFARTFHGADIVTVACKSYKTILSPSHRVTPCGRTKGFLGFHYHSTLWMVPRSEARYVISAPRCRSDGDYCPVESGDPCSRTWMQSEVSGRSLNRSRMSVKGMRCLPRELLPGMCNSFPFHLIFVAQRRV